MATTEELARKLEQQQKDYLSRLEKGGQLPSVISEAWKQAGGEEQKRLRGEEAQLLTDYISAGARGREKYKDVWDPFARERLTASETALSYKPIADIRSELAMRAEALGVATTGATAMYGAQTQAAQTSLGFSESAYTRALAREQEEQRREEGRRAEETRQRERSEDIARQISEAAKGRASKGTSSKAADKAAEKQAAADVKKQAEFETKISHNLSKLSNGEIDWGEAFWDVKNKFPEVPDSTIDNLMNKVFWGQEGAYGRTKGWWK